MKALLTGITGQDGSYLVEHLLELGYEVHGVIRRSSSFNTARIDHLYRDPHESGVRMFTHYGDLSDPVSLTRLIYGLGPDEIYNLGAQSHVGVSFQVPEYTFDITGAGTLRLLDAVREAEVETRIYQAGSSEMFGATPPPQSEASPFHPRSPYAVAKVAAHWMAVNYREAYGMYVSNGILFNHESPRRGETFVTRKITRAVARIKAGLQEKLYLGNLDAQRDWGYAPGLREGDAARSSRSPKPDDWVIATGEMHSVREFCERAFEHRRSRLVRGLRRDRPAVLPAGRGRRPAGRRREGARRARLGAAGVVRRAWSRSWSRPTSLQLADQLAGKVVALQPRGHRMTGARPDPALAGQGRRRHRRRRLSRQAHASRCSTQLGAEVRVVRSSEHDLTDPEAARVAVAGAEVVFHLAANVGGIGYNRNNPAPLAYDNLMMGANVFEASRAAGVGKLVAACSVCAYPLHTPVPFREETIWDGYPESSNAPYGLAKKMLLVLSDAYRRQYGFDSCAPVIANLYGPDDNFDLNDSHVIAAMVRKFCEAADEGRPQVTLWGSGEPSREFLYVDDAARGLVLCAERLETSEPMNLGVGQETRIRDLAELISVGCGIRRRGRLGLIDARRADEARARRLEGARADRLRGRGPARGGDRAHGRLVARVALTRCGAWTQVLRRNGLPANDPDQELRDVDGVATAEPSRLLEQPVEPEQSQRAEPRRRLLSQSGVHVEGGADADHHRRSPRFARSSRPSTDPAWASRVRPRPAARRSP